MNWNTNNLLNQITSRSVAPYVDVAGVANPTTNVTVSAAGQTFTAARRGDYFHHALSVPNSSAQYPTVEVTSAFTNWTESGQVYVPATPEAFTYDADGNLTSDGRWAYTWDGENRLIGMLSLTNAPAESKRWLQFKYDHQGRRILKTVCWWTNSAWRVVVSNKFLYDGWNLVAELNATNNAVIRSYVWGTDLSGTLDGAGGVGGLVMMTDAGSRYFPAYDGNGNVVGLTSASDGSLAAAYEYGPFAEPLRLTGPKAKSNPIRFSTKYTDDESGFLYYGYRYYNPGTGRWLSSDPIAERGGFNLYCFVGNSPVRRTDPAGLGWYDPDDDLSGRAAVIYCDNGVVKVDLGWATGTVHADCTRKHEEQHIRDWEGRFGRWCNHCLGKYAAPDADADFVQESECKAHLIAFECRLEQLGMVPWNQQTVDDIVRVIYGDLLKAEHVYKCSWPQSLLRIEAGNQLCFPAYGVCIPALGQ